MGIEIAFPVLALFASAILGLLALSFASRAIAGGFIPALAVVAGILWISLFVVIDYIEVDATAFIPNITNATTIDHEIPNNSSTLIMSNTVAPTDTQIGGAVGASNQAEGTKITASSALNGKQIDTMTWRLKKLGSPTGTATFGICSSTVTMVKAFGTKDVSTLTTSYADFNFTLGAGQPDHTLATGDYICASFTGGTVNVHDMRTPYSAANPYDGTATHISQSVTPPTWGDATGGDLYLKLYDNDLTTTLEDATLITTFNYTDNSKIDFNDGATKIYMVAVGVLFMVLGVMQRFDKE